LPCEQACAHRDRRRCIAPQPQVAAPGIGSEVELWSSNIQVGDDAASASTFAYELLCNAKRASRVTKPLRLKGSGVGRRHCGMS
jgi:hypothetical protein